MSSAGVAEGEGRPGPACPPPWAAFSGYKRAGHNQGGTRASARDGGYPVAAPTTHLAPNALMRRLDGAFDGDGHPLDAAEQSGRPQPPILGGFLAVMPEAADSSSRMPPSIVAPRVGSRLMVALLEVVWEIAGAGDEPHRRTVGGFRSRQHRGFSAKEWLPQIGDAAIAARRLASPASSSRCSLASP